MPWEPFLIFGGFTARYVATVYGYTKFSLIQATLGPAQNILIALLTCLIVFATLSLNDRPNGSVRFVFPCFE